MDKNQDSRVLSGDRLSHLPCTIIGDILALLPLKEAARTSVLSKKWKDKWLTIPCLVFEQDASEWFIYYILRLHKGPIVKFSIEYHYTRSCTALYNWFNILSKHRIEELTIMLSSIKHFKLVPNHLFSFYNLKHLSLRRVEVRLPLSMYNGFSNLISIKFDEVIIKVEELQRLIDKCPKLEVLTLVDCFKVKNSTLHISTPDSLKSFLFEGSVDFIYIYSNPHLEDVSISFWECDLNSLSDTVLNYAMKFFGQLSMIKKLEVNCHFLKVLARSVPSMLPKSLFHLEHIHFETNCTDSVNDLIYVLWLIRSSPNLQSIVISDYSYWEYEHPETAIEYMKEEQKLAVPISSSLKELKIRGLFTLEMEFVKLLILRAPELRKVEITGIFIERQLDVRETLESFRRSSSLEIIFKGWDID